jgi:tetratricopeptide (TPR) repeat protein
VAEIVGLPAGRVRVLARSGVLAAGRNNRGHYRFGFQDLVVLRAARALLDLGLPFGRIRRGLASLREQLPSGRSLGSVALLAEGDRVVVHEGDASWEPETGQTTLDFTVADLAVRTEPVARRELERHLEREELSADEWFDLGHDLEAVSPAEARRAYGAALRSNPRHSEALLNLGRLRHEDGALAEAEELYRRALEAEPCAPLGWFNLGVALEDQGRIDAAMAAYQQAVRCDASHAEAHFNLSRLCERSGDVTAAVRHLSAYKRLLEGA